MPHHGFLMKFFRNLFTQNIGLKFFSLLLAFAVWRLISSEDVAEVGFSVPLELRNIPERVEVVGDAVNSVDIRVRASSNVIKRLSSADMYIYLDLSHPSLGEHTYPLTSSNVQSPTGVEVVRLIPTHVKLRLERTASRTVPVKTRLRGVIPASKGFAELEVTPKEVVVEGPESRISDVSQVFTDMIDVNQLTLNETLEVNLAVDDPTIRLSPEKVKVRAIPLAKNLSDRKSPS